MNINVSLKKLALVIISHQECLLIYSTYIYCKLKKKYKQYHLPWKQ